MNILVKFRQGISKSSNFLTTSIKKTVSNRMVDENLLQEIEDILISADLGVNVARQLINHLKKIKISSKINIKTLQMILAEKIEKIIIDREKSLSFEITKKPDVIIFVGVNGSGKTTTIGKLANKLSLKYKVLIAACDTFRAAAVEQVKEWALKSNVKIYEGKNNQDPASVAFEACSEAKEKNYDILLIDTAGRLSNNKDLMNQLSKIKGVISKTLNQENIKTLLILDGSTGSNILNQFETFYNIIGISGIIITKLDGTAKGGSLVSIASRYEVPIYFVGMGEGIDDLYNFKAREFALALFNLENINLS